MASLGGPTVKERVASPSSCVGEGAQKSMVQLKNLETHGVDAIDFQEDDAVLIFLRDTLDLHKHNEIESRTTLASIAIVLSVWARKYPELERRFRSSEASDFLEPVCNVE